MPGFDGTGPRGEGPFTGGGEGYCAVKLPEDGSGPVIGYAGREDPLRQRRLMDRPATAPPALSGQYGRWSPPRTTLRRFWRRGRPGRRGRWGRRV